MACIGSSYTFQSSGTVDGNAQNSVVMAPTSNGSILLTYKQNGTTVQTRFLKVTALVLSANLQTRTLSWTNVGAASYQLSAQEGGSLSETIQVLSTTYAIPDFPFIDRSYTVTCTVNGETLPTSNSVSVPGVIPDVVFQTTQTFQTNDTGTSISAGTYGLQDLLTQLNTGLNRSGLFTFDGRNVSFNASPGILIPGSGQQTADTILILQHLGFVMLGGSAQIPINEVVDTTIQASNPIQLTQGETPTAPTQPTNLAVTDITPTTATLTVDITDYENVQFVSVVVQNGTQWEGTGVSVIEPDSNSVTIPLTDLTPNMEQTYAIQTTTSFDLSPVSEPITFTTLLSEGPPAPTQLGFIPTPVRTPRLEWTSTGVDPHTFIVNVQQGGVLFQSVPTGRGFPYYYDFPADQLSIGSSYSFSVQNGKTESTQLEVTIPTVLTPPTITTSSVSTDSMVIVCTDTNDGSGLGETTFDITIDPGNQDGVIGFSNVSSPYTLTGLNPNTQQTLSAATRFVSGGARITEYSTPITVTTAPIPTDLTFTSTPIRTPRLDWSWAGDAVEFTIHVQDDQSTLIQSFTSPFPFFEFPVDQLQVGTSYLLGVQVTTESTRLPITIPNTFSLPIVSVDSVSMNSLVLSFTDTNDGSGNGSTQFDLTISPADQNGVTFFSDLTSPYTLQNLSPGTTQTLTVVAKFASGGPQTTDSSNSVTGTTSQPPPLISDTWVFNDAQGLIPAGECLLVPDLPTLEDLYAFHASYLSSSNITYNGDLFANGALVGKQVTLTNGSTYSQKQIITNSSALDTDFLIEFQQISGGNGTLRSSLIGTPVTFEVSNS